MTQSSLCELSRPVSLLANTKHELGSHVCIVIFDLLCSVQPVRILVVSSEMLATKSELPNLTKLCLLLTKRILRLVRDYQADPSRTPAW